ncbi:hypothetical protein [Serinibacter salmoneus]|uniref:Galactosyl transferase GMA12/MNN10 family protein n=1 Tax=Serinibacter salmoneus TaxID=556530 RepID=A0A2A9D2Q8_9MICO|nr:hypothetical protein [Serinibacter salmoneus]PFG20140.1 galactosyl transferase GMA12/MNN10 family protein [Serinibacter salmoneus]
MSITIVSGHSNPATPAPLNHRAYAQRHGYAYVFDATPYPLETVWDQKLLAILQVMKDPETEWIFWIDDDAIFTQLDVPLTQLRGKDVDAPWGPAADTDRRDIPLLERPESFHVCRSPVNPFGEWSAINAGLMIIRNTATMRDFIATILHTPMESVAAWWDPEVNGNLYADDGDQERMQYLIATRGLAEQVGLHDPLAFNSRTYHLAERLDELFVCHLANYRDKVQGYRELRERFGLSEYLLPPDELDHELYRHSMFFHRPALLPQCGADPASESESEPAPTTRPLPPLTSRGARIVGDLEWQGRRLARWTITRLRGGG